MAQKTKIKKDSIGLYVIAGGYIARPFYGTIFKEGDVVKSHHFGGSVDAGVTTLSENFQWRGNKGNFEYWCTTGIISSEYDTMSESEIYEDTEWYRNHQKSTSHIYEAHNENVKALLNNIQNA